MIQSKSASTPSAWKFSASTPLTAWDVRWRCVEFGFDDEPFELPNDTNGLRVRSSSILWQNERLPNVAVYNLPDHCAKVVWTVSDVCFSNRFWLPDTSSTLDDYMVVQPVDHAVRLPRYAVDGGGTEHRSCKARRSNLRARTMRSRRPVVTFDYRGHGHSRYTWLAI
jgi:hypothetical protein